MLEDVYRLRRDMMLFMTRSGKLADAMKDGAGHTEGSSSIGFAAVSAALFQVSKVFRNYLAVLDKEIEDVDPGALDRFDAEDLLDSMTDIKARVDSARKPMGKVSYVAHLMGDERREGETDQALFDRLAREYSDLTNQIMRGQASDADKLRQQKLTIWNAAA